MARRIPLTRFMSAALGRSYRQIAADLGGPARFFNLRTGKPNLFHNIRSKSQFGDKDQGKALQSGHFEFGGQSLDIGQQGDPWTIPAPSERYAIWLHQFTWLPDLLILNDKAANIRARMLIDRWIAVYGKWNRFAWEPDILAHRLYMWLSLWSPALQTDSLGEAAQIRRNATLRQLKRLRRTYKRTTPGLDRLRAAAALTLGGARLQENSESYFSRGLDWLDDEIELQILPDGGHISRSPIQTYEALRVLQSVDSLLQARGLEGSRALSRGIDRLLPIIPFFMTTDGGLAGFHGSGEGPKADILKTIKAAKLNAKPFGYCPHSYYQRIEQNGTVVLMDAGTSPPHPFDSEAHIAPLAIDVSTIAGRLFVNCGWNANQPAHWRRPMRETAAHSTLILGHQSAGTLSKPGWQSWVLNESITKEAGPVHVSRKEQVTGVWLEAAHEGYQKTSGLNHRRRLYLDIDGQDLRGEDSLFVPMGRAPLSREETPFKIRFHLHPDVRVTLAQNLQSALLIQPGNVGWRFRTDGGPLSIEPSVYLGDGHKPVKSEQLVISGRAIGDSDGETRSNRIRWSLRRLEANP